jgi:hypothetical protein
MKTRRISPNKIDIEKCRHGHLRVSLAWANLDMTSLISQMTKPTAVDEAPKAMKAAEKAKEGKQQ